VPGGGSFPFCFSPSPDPPQGGSVSLTVGSPLVFLFLKRRTSLFSGKSWSGRKVGVSKAVSVFFVCETFSEFFLGGPPF